MGCLRLPRRLLLLLIAAVFACLVPAAALAHAALESASPGPGGTVVGSPPELVLRFDQDLDPSRTFVELRDASGATLARGGALGSGPRELRLQPPVLAPGQYEVRWTSYSAEDKELARDNYTFVVVAAPSPTTALTAAPSAAPTGTATPPATVPPASAGPTASGPTNPGRGDPAGGAAVLVPVLAALAIVGGLTLWTRRRR